MLDESYDSTEFRRRVQSSVPAPCPIHRASISRDEWACRPDSFIWNRRYLISAIANSVA